MGGEKGVNGLRRKRAAVDVARVSALGIVVVGGPMAKYSCEVVGDLRQVGVGIFVLFMWGEVV